jgi:hypothetical protein
LPKTEINPSNDGAPMPNEENRILDDAMDFKDIMLRNFALLALPWLALQQDMLKIAKKGVEETKSTSPFQKFTAWEFHALTMILDPSGTLRSPFDADFEAGAKDAYDKVLPNLVSGSLAFIEAQNIVLEQISKGLMKMKNGDETKRQSK